MMKVLFLITGLRIGGAERLLYLVCRELVKNNVRIEIIYFDAGAEMLPLFEQLPVTVTRYKYTLLSVFPLIRHLRRQRFDVVHTHLIFADIIGRLAALFAPVKIFSSVHGIEWYHRKNTLPARIVRLADRLLGRWSGGHYIAVSRAVKQVLVDLVKISPDSITLLYNAIPLHENKTPRQQKRKALRLLFVGRLTKQKNVVCLLRAVSLLKNKNLGLTVVGDGPCMPKLKNMAKELQLEQTLTFNGAQLDVREHYQSHHLLVLPSLYEGLGIVILEAFSYGLPVIGSDVGGITELLSGDRGVLFESDNHQDLADKIQLLDENENTRRQLGRNGLAYVKKNHDIDNYTRKLCQLYDFPCPEK